MDYFKVMITMVLVIKMSLKQRLVSLHCLSHVSAVLDTTSDSNMDCFKVRTNMVPVMKMSLKQRLIRVYTVCQSFQQF